MQMLHCREQNGVIGGENILVDGFNAAKVLKKEDPQAFEWTTSAELDHEDIGQDFVKYHLLTRKPIFQ